MSQKLRPAFICLFVFSMSMLVSFARADMAAAQKALEDAKSAIVSSSWDDADTNVKLAATELDGLSEADKKIVQAQIDQITKQITDGKALGDKADYIKHADEFLKEAKDLLSEHPDPDGVVAQSNALDEFLAKDEVKAALTPDQIAGYKSQMAKYKTVATAKGTANQVEFVGQEFERLKTNFNEKMPVIKSPGNPGEHDNEIRDLGRDLEIFQKHLEPLPQDNAKVKTMVAAFKQMNDTFNASANSAQAATVLAALKSGWEIYADEYNGWESEPGPGTFEQMSKTNEQKLHAFNKPKTKAAIDRSEQFFDNRKNDNDYAAVKDVPDVKAYMDSIHKIHDDAYGKMLAAVKQVVDEAEKTPVSRDNKIGMDELKSDIRLALGENSPDSAALQERIQKLSTGFEQATAGAAEAKEKLAKDMIAKAAADWPAMKAKFSPVTGFDPNNYKDFVGKQIIIHTDNLMGYRFNPNDFPFATTLNGEPIACRYSRVVKEAIDDVEKKIGRGIGDSDDDGKWEIICTVDGKTGRLMQRKQLESDVKTDSGEKVGTLKGEYSDPVEAPIVTIIAAHCGPLAVAAESASSADTVAVTSAGTVVHNGHSSFLGWVWRFFVLIVGLVAAAAALMKANFAPLTSVPQIGQVQSQVGSNNLGLIGIVCAVFGVIFLLWGLIIFGLLVNLSIIAAGLYAGLDVLVGAGAVKPEAAAKLRPLGIPIGLACAALVILELFIAGRFYIL